MSAHDDLSSSNVPSSDPEIRPPRADEVDSCSRLYADYADFYGVPQTEADRALVWSWIHDPAHPLGALVAVRSTALVGLAHYRPFPRPLAAGTGGYLDDLYVDPAARNLGAGRALLEELQRIALLHGWSVVRWITAEDNTTARALYDTAATATRWVTYDMAPEPRGAR